MRYILLFDTTNDSEMQRRHIKQIQLIRAICDGSEMNNFVFYFFAPKFKYASDIADAPTNCILSDTDMYLYTARDLEVTHDAIHIALHHIFNKIFWEIRCAYGFRLIRTYSKAFGLFSVRKQPVMFVFTFPLSFAFNLVRNTTQNSLFPMLFPSILINCCPRLMMLIHVITNAHNTLARFLDPMKHERVKDSEWEWVRGREGIKWKEKYSKIDTYIYFSGMGDLSEV